MRKFMEEGVTNESESGERKMEKKDRKNYKQEGRPWSSNPDLCVKNDWHTQQTDLK